MPDWNSISNAIQEAGGGSVDVNTVRSVGGGCINSAYSLKTQNRQIFIKLNAASKLAMFEAESEGLIELARSHSIKVPEPLCCGIAGNDAFIAMENLSLGGSGDAHQLGQSLAAIHRVTRCFNGQPLYGWTRENTIGSTTQRNDDENNWTTFWFKHRLGFQLDLARRSGANGQIIERGERLSEGLEEFFSGYRPEASLLHGDLWSGNVAFEPSGNPVIFDPAVYYGDRETDLNVLVAKNNHRGLLRYLRCGASVSVPQRGGCAPRAQPCGDGPPAACRRALRNGPASERSRTLPL